MEIKIDTKHDSPDDIKKAIEFLRRMVGESTGQNEASAIAQNSEVTSSMVSLFGDTPIMGEESSTCTESNKNAFGKTFGDEDDDSSAEEEKEEIKIIPY